MNSGFLNGCEDNPGGQALTNLHMLAEKLGPISRTSIVGTRRPSVDVPDRVPPPTGPASAARTLDNWTKGASTEPISKAPCWLTAGSDISDTRQRRRSRRRRSAPDQRQVRDQRPRTRSTKRPQTPRRTEQRLGGSSAQNTVPGTVTGQEEVRAAAPTSCRLQPAGRRPGGESGQRSGGGRSRRADTFKDGQPCRVIREANRVPGQAGVGPRVLQGHVPQLQYLHLPVGGVKAGRLEQNRPRPRGTDP